MRIRDGVIGGDSTGRWTRVARRRFGRSFAQRGAAGTLARCVSHPVRRGFSAIAGTDRRVRRAEATFDLEHGVDTRRDRDAAWIANLESPNWRHGEGYELVSGVLVSALIERLGIDLHAYAFIDYGSGKGKALFQASHFPFRTVIGVEYTRQLHEVAERNLDVHRSPARRCVEVTSICCDAIDFEPPPMPTVAFFHHPFDGCVFDRVLNRIDGSLKTDPGPLLVLYVDPRCGDRFLRWGYRELARDGDRWAIFAARGTEHAS